MPDETKAPSSFRTLSYSPGEAYPSSYSVSGCREPLGCGSQL